MIGEGYEVRGDLYDIADRIREIDENYFIFYSYRHKRYEVHNRAQRNGTFALALPYRTLDARALTLVRRTRAERADALLREIEEENARSRRAAVEKTAERAACEAERVFKEVKL